MAEFRAWPKIARWNREIVITEKIDGTNAAVVISDELLGDWETGTVLGEGVVVSTEGKSLLVAAQSRTRIITPEQDNHGFAKWVRDNAVDLVSTLGVGYHFGEWWGSGINRGYGLQKGEKRFSLFNTSRWEKAADFAVPGLGVVPILSVVQGSALDFSLDQALWYLRAQGSLAAPGFMKPEGLVLYHSAANKCFKITLENDDAPKGQG